MVDSIQEFVVNFQQSRNAKEQRFSKRPSQQKKTKTSKASEICRISHICDFTISENQILNLLLHKGNIVIPQFKKLATV